MRRGSDGELAQPTTRAAIVLLAVAIFAAGFFCGVQWMAR